MTYYRPENKFPSRVFGGFASDHQNPEHCSVDLFSYLSYPPGKKLADLPPDWHLRESSCSDYWEFGQFYRNCYGGLFGSIIKSESGQKTMSVEEAFAASGFVRRWKTFALVHHHQMKAFIIVEESDVGINLSNLLNGFKVFVMDPDLNPDILLGAVSKIMDGDLQESNSLLISPADYADKYFIEWDRKKYALWILDMQYANEYIGHLGQKYRIRFD